MLNTATIILAAAISAAPAEPAPPAPAEGKRILAPIIHFEPGYAAGCTNPTGCVAMTREAFIRAMEQAERAGAAKAAATCRRRDL